MGILTASAIKAHIGLRQIILDPYDEKQLNPNSYNLRLHNELHIYKTKLLDAKIKNGTYSVLIPEDGYVLEPGVLYLGRTVEKTTSIGLAPMLEGRSSYARLGLSVHSSAGFGDIGFCGHWTLELSVVQPLCIYPFSEIAQISWHTISGNIDRTYKGKYQDNVDTQESHAYEDFKPKETVDTETVIKKSPKDDDGGFYDDNSLNNNPSRS